ncbi:MAG: hypothetical protein FJ387_24450 [Verrucomicrobia bacterium]|nr:hypothetical protein [Verrucomicrobiota bacterium]
MPRGSPIPTGWTRPASKARTPPRCRPARPRTSSGWSGPNAIQPMKTSFFRQIAAAFTLVVATSRLALAGDINPVLVGSWPEFPRGYPSAVAVAGNRACVAGGGGLVVLDISDPRQPRRLGSYRRGEDSFADVAVAGNFAFANGSNTEFGFEVIDISNPSNPQRVGGYSRYFGSMAFLGSHAYAADGTRFEVIDISDPANPSLAGQCALTHGGYQIAVSEKYACRIAPWSGWIEIIDISDPAHPRSVGGYQLAGSVFDAPISISGSNVYVSWGGDLSVLDISNPANPQRIAFLAGSGGSRLAVSANLLVVGTGWNTPDQGSTSGLRLFEISNPAAPRPLATIATGQDSDATDIALSGNYIYLVNSRGFHAFDISNPLEPKRVGDYAVGQTQASAVAGNYAYVADGWEGLQVLDVSDSAHPRRVGGYADGYFASDVAVDGHHAYVLVGDSWWDTAALNVIDVANPADPRKVGVVANIGNLARVVVSSRYAYVLDPSNLIIIDVLDPSNPREIGRLVGVVGGLGFGFQFAVSGERAYVKPGGGGGEFYVIDLSNPAEPQRLGGYYDRDQIVFQIAALGTRVYLLGEDRWTGLDYLDVLDSSDPAAPRRLGRCSVKALGSPRLAASGNYAYISGKDWDDTRRHWIQVIDVSDPTGPHQIGEVCFVESENEYVPITVSQGRIFASVSFRGLILFQMPPFIKSIAKEGPNVKLDWEGFGPARLQRATRLTNPDWLELPGFEGTNTAALPANGGAEFFRLVRP